MTQHWIYEIFKLLIYMYMNMNLIIALRRFLHNHGDIKEARSRNYALLLFWMTTRVLYSAQYHSSTVHSIHFNSLDQFICTTTMTNVRPDRDSNLVPSGYNNKPQSIQMCAQGRPARNPYLLSGEITVGAVLVTIIEKKTEGCIPLTRF